MIQHIYNFFFYLTLQNGKVEYHTILGRGASEGDSKAVCVSMQGLTLSMIIQNVMGGIKFKVFRHKHTHSITKIIKNSAACKPARPLLLVASRYILKDLFIPAKGAFINIYIDRFCSAVVLQGHFVNLTPIPRLFISAKGGTRGHQIVLVHPYGTSFQPFRYANRPPDIPSPDRAGQTVFRIICNL